MKNLAIWTLAIACLAGFGGTEPRSAVAAPAVDIWTAAAKGNIEAIEQHAAAGTDLDAKEPSGSTPLIVAAVFGQTEAAGLLVRNGAELEARNSDGATALMAAAFLCHRQTVELLLESGAGVNARNNAGQTPLDTVSGEWGPELEGIYTYFAGVLHIDLDLDDIKSLRPVIADILREHGGKPGSELKAGAAEYTPLPRDDWEVSTPAEQGLDPTLVAELYDDAAELETLYGLLVIKNGHLIAEGYFNEGSVDQLSGRQSATKSVTSALVGVALDQGCLSSVDQKMIDFFPELADQITDPRKKQVTIRELLQMRAGYPWEGRTPPYFDMLYLRDNWQWLPHIVDFPLTSDPGSRYGYSNLTSHILAVIVARACDTDLKSYAEERLFSPIGAEVGGWTPDPNGYNWGWGEIYVTARDMAKFGLLYLNDGQYEGKQVISADWVSDSLQRYSEDINFTGWFSSKAGRYFSDIGYGYQWWSATVGDHRFDFAWGHGGQLIILLDELDMIIVTTADPLFELPEEKGWKYEGAIIDVVGKFIDSLPEGDASKPD